MPDPQPCPTGKWPYPSAAAAWNALPAIRRRRHGRHAERSAYRCTTCHAWHLTHWPTQR